MASSLPEELVQEILVRLPLDEPMNLVHASLVCKAWRRVLSNRGCFLRRSREFHGGARPVLGYFRSRYYSGSPIGFVSATSNASPVRMPAVDHCSGWFALDCRHGRVLIRDAKEELSKRLIVWDPITGSQERLSVPPYSHYQASSTYCNAGAVLCAEKNGCDHLDCHGGPFMVVIVLAERDNDSTNLFAWASIYSSKTSDWSVPTSYIINHHGWYNIYSAVCKQNLLIGDALYFTFVSDKSFIIKYDLHEHWLSDIDMPQDVWGGRLMTAEDGGLQLANLKNNYIYLWSRQDITNGIGGWVEQSVMELETLVPRPIKCEPYQVIGSVEGTNIIFINISAGVLMLDIKSKNVRKFGEIEYDLANPILPYVSFYAPR